MARLFLSDALIGSLQWFEGGPVTLRAVADEFTKLLPHGLYGPASTGSRNRVEAIRQREDDGRRRSDVAEMKMLGISRRE